MRLNTRCWNMAIEATKEQGPAHLSERVRGEVGVALSVSLGHRSSLEAQIRVKSRHRDGAADEADQKLKDWKRGRSDPDLRERRRRGRVSTFLTPSAVNPTETRRRHVFIS